MANKKHFLWGMAACTLLFSAVSCEAERYEWTYETKFSFKVSFLGDYVSELSNTDALKFSFFYAPNGKLGSDEPVDFDIETINSSDFLNGQRETSEIISSKLASTVSSDISLGSLDRWRHTVEAENGNTVVTFTYGVSYFGGDPMNSTSAYSSHEALFTSNKEYYVYGIKLSADSLLCVPSKKYFNTSYLNSNDTQLRINDSALSSDDRKVYLRDISAYLPEKITFGSNIHFQFLNQAQPNSAYGFYIKYYTGTSDNMHRKVAVYPNDFTYF